MIEALRRKGDRLFADVKGSMELAEQVDPEEWHRIIDRFFAILADGVHRFEGTVEPVHRRRHHGALRRADRARGSRAARLLRGAPPARRAPPLRRRAAPRRAGSTSPCASGSTPARSWSARSATTCAWTTRRRATPSASRRAWSSSPSRASVYLTEHTARAGRAASSSSRDLGAFDGQGRARAGARLRARGRRRAAHAPRRLARARLLALRRARRRDARRSRRALTRAREGDGAGRRRRRRAGRRQEPALLRVRSSAAGRAASWSTRRTASRTARRSRSCRCCELLRELLRHRRAGQRRDGAREDRRPRCCCSTRRSRDEPAARLRLPRCSGSRATRRRAMDPEARQRQLFDIVRAWSHAREPREPAVIAARGPALVRRRRARRSSSRCVEALRRARARSSLLELPARVPGAAGWRSPYYQQLAARAARAGRDRASCSMSCSAPIHRSPGSPTRIRERTRRESVLHRGGGAVAGRVGDARGHARARIGSSRRSTSSTMPRDACRPCSAARIDRLAEQREGGAADRRRDRPEFAGADARARRRAVDAAAARATRCRASSTAEFVYRAVALPGARSTPSSIRSRRRSRYRSQLGERRAALHAAVARAIAELDPERVDELAALVAHHWESAGDALEAARWRARAGAWAGLRIRCLARPLAQVRELTDRWTARPRRPGSGWQRASSA